MKRTARQPPPVGAPVRVLRGVEKRYRAYTFIVRAVQQDLIRVDNGNPEDPDLSTNGAAVSVWLKPSEIEPWAGEPCRPQSARLAEELRCAKADLERLRGHAEALHRLLQAAGHRPWCRDDIRQARDALDAYRKDFPQVPATIPVHVPTQE